MSSFFNWVSVIGVVVTAIVGVFTTNSTRTKLKVTGQFPLFGNGIFLIQIINPRNTDNEIKSIVFYKGNPRTFTKMPFFAVNLAECKGETNPSNNNIIIRQNTSLDIPVLTSCIIRHYDVLGESFGKPFDKIFVVVEDIKGHSYYINTEKNIDYIRNFCS